jgi:very-short-patch-repair endonuclease
MQRNDWLEQEEEELREARRTEFQASEEVGLVSFSSAVQRAVAVAGAAVGMAHDCESPIEVALGSQLKLLIEIWNESLTPQLELVPQYPLLRFRYDFGIVADSKLIAIVECDGKDFHSSEAAQANDAAKNVAAWRAGAEVFRFPGSEIFRRDAYCAECVVSFLRSKFKQEAA